MTGGAPWREGHCPKVRVIALLLTQLNSLLNENTSSPSSSVTIEPACFARRSTGRISIASWTTQRTIRQGTVSVRVFARELMLHITHFWLCAHSDELQLEVEGVGPTR
jgi:hypothetical protein